MSKTVIVAIGGNSIVKDNDSNSIEMQYKAACELAEHIADMVEQGYEIVVTHGNGPQVGFALQRSEIANSVNKNLPEVPLVNCVADTQGGIAYQLQQALANEFLKRNINKQVVSVITQVEVDKNDDNFKNPTKPIGSFLTEQQKEEMKLENPDWNFVEDSGRGYRRVVPSPQPINIVEKRAIERLIREGFVVIAVGGGGIPVIKTDSGIYEGIDAVIDKDLATSLLAEQISASTLVITTGVEKVCINFGKSNEQELGETSITEMEQYVKEGHFPAGSMLPKIEASLKFLNNNGERVIITTPEKLNEALLRKNGTHIVK